MNTERKEIEYVHPVRGAAKYEAVGKEIWMTEPDGYQSHIDTKGTHETAAKSAVAWQKKENKAVLKSRK